MNLSRYLPVALGAILIAGALGAVLFWSPGNVEEEIVAPAIEHLRQKYAKLGREEGRDYQVEPPRIVRRDDRTAVVALFVRGPVDEGAKFFQVRRGDRGWEFDRDLILAFETRMREEIPRMAERLNARLTERFRGPPGFREPHQVTVRLFDEGGQVIGDVNILFHERGGPGRYVERFRYEGGSWVAEGGGQLFDAAPAPAMRR